MREPHGSFTGPLEADDYTDTDAQLEVQLLCIILVSSRTPYRTPAKFIQQLEKASF